MLHPPSPAAPCRPGRDADQSRVVRPSAWPQGGPRAASVAVLVTGCGDTAAVVRSLRTVFPRARLVHGGGAIAAVEAGPSRSDRDGRAAQVRRLFSDVDADIYVLADRATASDACAALLAVSEVEAGKDLVGVGRPYQVDGRDFVDDVMCRTVDFAFGRGGHLIDAHMHICSHRFAQSYLRAAPTASSDDAFTRDFALHALRLRMPVAGVAALAAPATRDPRAPGRTAVARLAQARSMARLLVEERPRRVFGLLGIALILTGVAVAAPELAVYRWRMTILPGARTAAIAALLVGGGITGAVGLLLDVLASARQEVGRLGIAAMPRRAERHRPETEGATVPARRITSA